MICTLHYIKRLILCSTYDLITSQAFNYNEARRCIKNILRVLVCLVKMCSETIIKHYQIFREVKWNAHKKRGYLLEEFSIKYIKSSIYVLVNEHKYKLCTSTILLF